MLKRECLLQEQRVFASLEDIAFSRRGRPLHGLSKRGDHCSSRSALRAFRKHWTQRQFSRLVDDKSQNGPNFVTPNPCRSNSWLLSSHSSVLLIHNSVFHHSKAAKEYAAQIGIDLLFVPAYALWVNPIAGVFYVVKRHVCAHGSIDESLASVIPFFE